MLLNQQRQPELVFHLTLTYYMTIVFFGQLLDIRTPRVVCANCLNEHLKRECGIYEDAVISESCGSNPLSSWICVNVLIRTHTLT